VSESSSFPGIEYSSGDATSPKIEGPVLIAHFCSNDNKWGDVFSRSLSARDARPEESYRRWFAAAGDSYRLGRVEFVDYLKPEWAVANMIVMEESLRGSDDIRGLALEEAFGRVANHAFSLKATVCVPRIPEMFRGMQWDLVEGIITKTLVDAEIPVVVVG